MKGSRNHKETHAQTVAGWIKILHLFPSFSSYVADGTQFTWNVCIHWCIWCMKWRMWCFSWIKIISLHSEYPSSCYRKDLFALQTYTHKDREFSERKFLWAAPQHLVFGRTAIWDNDWGQDIRHNTHTIRKVCLLANFTPSNVLSLSFHFFFLCV